jgi:hypothetical protein
MNIFSLLKTWQTNDLSLRNLYSVFTYRVATREQFHSFKDGLHVLGIKYIYCT